MHLYSGQSTPRVIPSPGIHGLAFLRLFGMGPAPTLAHLPWRTYPYSYALLTPLYKEGPPTEQSPACSRTRGLRPEVRRASFPYSHVAPPGSSISVNSEEGPY